MNKGSFDWNKFNLEFNAKLDAKYLPKLERLKEEFKLLPLKQELLAYISSFISWIDLSNEWFLKSRDLKASHEEQKLNSIIYKFYRARASLILEKLSNLPKELQNG